MSMLDASLNEKNGMGKNKKWRGINLKLYRNISTNELYRLFVDGEISGKLHNPSQDTTYNPDEHGEVIFFFDYPAWLSYFNGYTVMVEVEVDEKDVIGEGKSIYRQDLSLYETNKYVSITYRREVYLRKYTSSQVTKIWTQMETLEEAVLNDIIDNDCLSQFNVYTTDECLLDLSLAEMKKTFDSIAEADINDFLDAVDEKVKQESDNLIYIFNFIRKYYDIIVLAEKDDYNFPSVMSGEGALKTEIIEKYSREGAVLK